MKLFNSKKEILLIIIVLAFTGFIHAKNMFGFPYYENDEGTYMSQAWSVLKDGSLAPYTYWYDHAPAGWFLIALWVKLTGGFFTFGTSVDSGRVLMLILHVVTSFLIYFISKKLSGKTLPGIIAILIYSLSPLAIYFQRRVLLDNIMTFWLFVSLALLLKDKLKLSGIVISGITLGIAILTKENAIFFTPAFLYVIFTRAHKNHKIFAIGLWATAIGAVVSTYFLYAVLKKEFLPMGFLGDKTEHVSLIDTIKYNLGRGTDLPFWNKRSDFGSVLVEWLKKDKKIVYIGGFATVLGLLFSIRKKYLRLPTLLAFLFLFFLIRGGIILGFYIVPLIPIFALLIGMVVELIIDSLKLNRYGYLYFSSVAVLAVIAGYMLGDKDYMYRNETAEQIKAIAYIKENIPEDAFLVIDDSLYVDLHEPGYINSKVYKNAEWSWKVEKDPEVTIGELNNDWRNINYIVLTHEITKLMHDYDNRLIEPAFLNSQLIADFSNSTTSYRDLKNFISTNGDWNSIYKVKDSTEILLAQYFKNYQSKFVKSYGQVVDPASGNTTSEGQSYYMLRAVWVDDKEAFDGAWNWTKDHLQKRTGDLLISWNWGKSGNTEKLLDANAASDADEDIALALIFASKKWNDPKYLLEALSLMRDVWNKEVVDIGGKKLLVSSPNSKRGNNYIVNPSYFSPGSYRIFAEVDSTHDWIKLADDSYYFLDLIGKSRDNTTYLPTNWILVNQNGTISSAASIISADSDYFGYDAFRTYFRVALDYKWHNNQNALNYLIKSQGFFLNKWNANSKFNAIYDLAGSEITDFSTPSTLTAPLSIFTITNPEIAKNIYTKEYLTNITNNSLMNSNNYFDQNWVWFTIALYNNKIPNLWNQSSQIASGN